MPLNTRIAFGGGGGDDQQDDPFAILGSFMQMRAQNETSKIRQNEIERQRLEIQKQQNAIDDDYEIDEALKRHLQPDQPPEIGIDAAANDLTSRGRGSAAIGLRNRVFAWQKSEADRRKVDLDNNIARFKLAGQMAQGITEDNFGQVVPNIAKLAGPDAAALIGDKYDPEKIQAAIDTGMTATENLEKQKFIFQKWKDVTELAQKAAQNNRAWETSLPDLNLKYTQLVSELMTTSTDQKTTDDNLALANKGMAGMPGEFREAVLGKFPSKYGPASKEIWRRLGMTQNEESQEAIARANLRLSQERLDRENNSDVPLSDDALDMIALKFAKTGSMDGIPFGLGPKAASDRKRIYDRAAGMYKDLDLASQRLAYTSNVKALTTMEPALYALKAYDKTALKNADTFLETAKKVVDSGSPWLNIPLRTIDEKLLGKPEMAAFRAAKGVVGPEFARIIQNPNLTGQLPVQARDEINVMLGDNYTYNQLYNVVKILKSDANNRITSQEEAVKAIKAAVKEPPPGSVATPANINRALTPPPLIGAVPTGQPSATGLQPNWTGVAATGGVSYNITTDANGNIVTRTPVGAPNTPTAVDPSAPTDAQKRMLDALSVNHRHTLSDGTVWDKLPDGTIRRVK